MLCLRLLRKYTETNRIRVIAIDNNSRDDSLKYLRSLNWIELIERIPKHDESGPLSHGRALDEGLSRVSTPYVMSIHTDTLIRQFGWLDVLLRPMEANTEVAGVGSWKLSQDTMIKAFGKKLHGTLMGTRQLFGLNTRRARKKRDIHERYLRSHCAIYRTDVLIKYNLSFSDPENLLPAGQLIHRTLTACGYQMVLLPPEALTPYLCHLDHATMAFNPELGSSRVSTLTRLIRIKQLLNKLNADEILNNPSLDE
jgi:hypothetical protein